MSAAIRTGYVKSPTEADSAPWRADLSLNWVIRLASPKPVSVLSTQASSACAGTCDCTNSVDFDGSMPEAMYCAAVARVLARSSAGSCGEVIACMSTTQ
jgi:hypothetical protein